MRWALSLLALVVTVVTWSADASAYAWMVRHGYTKCGTCHTDPSGGETLNHMGRVTSDTLLSQQWGADTGPGARSMFLFGVEEPGWLRLGGSVRGMAIHDVDSQRTVAFPMQADAYGSMEAGGFVAGVSVGASSASGRYEHTDKAVLAGELEDGNFVPVSRHHWVGYRPGSEWMLRAGRIALPFGLRVPEHTLWVRDATQTDRESDQQHGVAVAYSRGRLRGELMGIAGNFQLSESAARERGYAGFLEYMLSSRAAVGVNSMFLYSDVGLYSRVQDAQRQAHGLTVRYSPFTELVLMAEGNALLESHHELGYVGLLVADVEPVQGLHLVLTGEVLDRGARSEASVTPPLAPVIVEDIDSGSGFGEPRLGGWGSIVWYPYPHFDFRFDAVARSNRPLQLLFVSHFYF